MYEESPTLAIEQPPNFKKLEDFLGTNRIG